MADDQVHQLPPDRQFDEADHQGVVFNEEQAHGGIVSLGMQVTLVTKKSLCIV